MNNIKAFLDNYDFKIKKITISNNSYFVDTDKGKYVLKKKNNIDNYDLFKYLNSKAFNNYIQSINNYNDEFILLPYINTNDIDKEEKAKDVIELISILHFKTTFYKSFSIEEIKTNYEEYTDSINELISYYDNLRLVMEETEFLSPSMYYLLRNITVIFVSLNSSKYFLDKWYDIAKNKKNRRIVLIHGSLKLNHLLEGENKYLISWDNSHNDMPIYDLLYFYKNHYNELSFYELFKLYESKYPLLDEEKYLLFSLILIPRKIKFDKQEILNTKEVYNMINFLNTSNNIISKYYPSNTNNKQNLE